jgi:hypothetical protein
MMFGSSLQARSCRFCAVYLWLSQKLLFKLVHILNLDRLDKLLTINYLIKCATKLLIQDILKYFTGMST